MHLDRKYVILAGIVAFGSWALLTDWIPSLRWMPYAFIAGILTTIAGLVFLVLTISRGVYYREDAVRFTAPIAPAFTSAKAWEEEKAGLRSRAEYRRPTLFPEAVAFSKAVDGLLDLILCDYVTSWYSAISKRPLFQHEIDRCIRSVLVTVAARITNFDLVAIGMANILPMVTAHMNNFYDAERSVRGKDLSHNVTESEELGTAIAGKYKNGKLHPVALLSNADTTSAQQQHFRSLVSGLLPVLLPDNMKSSPAVTVMIREIVSCAILGPVTKILVDPDTWNQVIVNIGGPMLQDRKAVRKVRAALDQNAPASPKTTRSAQFPRLKPYDSERQFERFIRGIRQVSTLSDAQKIRSQIISQLRRDGVVEGQDAAYLRRLETGRRLLDQKIATLPANNTAKPTLSVQSPDTTDETASRKQQASLRELLYDATGLGLFMEYMDRLKLMRLVQFYIVVDGFRGPLEGDHDDAGPSIASDPERMDITRMYDDYLSKPELQTSAFALQAIKVCLARGLVATPQDYITARQAVLRTQTQVYDTMSKMHYPNFRSSDLFHKWLAVDDNLALAAAQRKQMPRTPSSDSAQSTETFPAKPRRQQLLPVNKGPELRRAVLSSSNLKDSAKSSYMSTQARRSLDDSRPRQALFDDDLDDERMAESLTSLRSYDSDGEAAQDETKAVNAMKLALHDIVGDEARNSFSPDSTGRQSFDESIVRTPLDQPKPALPPRTSSLQSRPALSTNSSELDKPSIASLGLVGAPSSRGVFVDDLFGEEAQKFAEDEQEDSDGPDLSEEHQVQEAAPGDLGLIEAIDALNAEVEKLAAQKHILDALTAKAELTNNEAELRILRKSEQSLEREIKRTEMQKQQYIVQESDNSLYGRAAVSIKSVMIGREDDGHEFALYVVEVRRQAGEQMAAATWAVTRRYSQFHELHKRLRARFPSVRELEFPRRQALFSLQKDFIRKRRATLERYLKSLLLVPAICRSRELRAFLSQSAISTNGNDSQVDAKDFVTRIYDSVSDGMDEFLGNIPVLDQLSVAGQNLISAATTQSNGVPAALSNIDPAVQNPGTVAEAEAELNACEAKEAEPFVKPICDLFLEAFELSKGNSWLRGRTVVVVLHQLLGGTIERKVREALHSATEDKSLARYVGLLQAIMWPDGKPRQVVTTRSLADKTRTRREASAILGALIPDLAGNVVGKANAQAASRKVIAMLNNDRLNTHLVFTIMDEVMKTVFPETLDKS